MKGRFRSLVCRPLAILGVVALAAVSWAGAQTPGQLVNLSVRKFIAPGENLVVGFTVGGVTSTRILVRAVGPGLADFGVYPSLSDPKISLTYQANAQQSVTVYNDDWNQQTSVGEFFAPVRMKILPIDSMPGAFPLRPGSLDAVLLVEVPPGSFTVTVSGAGPAATESGFVLAEIYNVTPKFEPNAGRLINLSALGKVTPSTPLIGGVVIAGESAVTLLGRVSGPSLAPFGVKDVLADPTLELTAADGTVLSRNDNWDAGAAASTVDIRQAGLQSGASPFLANSRDSAVLSTLKAGSYNLVATGVNGTSGTALIEAYEAKP